MASLLFVSHRHVFATAQPHRCSTSQAGGCHPPRRGSQGQGGAREGHQGEGSASNQVRMVLPEAICRGGRSRQLTANQAPVSPLPLHYSLFHSLISSPPSCLHSLRLLSCPGEGVSSPVHGKRGSKYLRKVGEERYWVLPLPCRY